MGAMFWKTSRGSGGGIAEVCILVMPGLVPGIHVFVAAKKN
jgi:hypothetical protein